MKQALSLLLCFACAISSVHSQALQSADQVQALTNEAINLIRMGNPGGALADLRTAVAYDPNSWIINFNIAVALEKLNRLDEAIQWYRKCYSLNPTQHLALLGIGRILYERKDYRDAIPVFAQLVNDHADTETTYSVLLSLARCYGETGQISDFENTMNAALKIRPADPQALRFAGQEADHIKDYKAAAEYYKEFLRRFPKSPDATAIGDRLNIVTFDEAEIEELKEVQFGFSLNKDTDDLKDFVTFLTPDHKGISDQAVGLVMLGLSEIPRTYRHQLEQAGYKVLVAPTVLDAMPQLSKSAPRGYSSGSSWHNSNGLFDREKKVIVIGEFCNAQALGGQLVLAPLDETVQHEFGHAYDLYLGTLKEGISLQNPFPEVSHGSEFKHAYDSDVASIPVALKSKLGYYLTPGDAGREELFAQMFLLLFGHRPEPGSPRESFQTAFPRVLTVMENARKGDPDYEHLKLVYDARLQENLLTPAQRIEEELAKP